MKKTSIKMVLAAILIGTLLTGCSAVKDTSSVTDNSTTVSSESYTESITANTADTTNSNASSSSTENTTSKDSASKQSESKTETKTETSSEKSTEITLNTSGVIDTTDMFSSRDLSQTADTKDAKALTVSDGKTIEMLQ